MGAAPTGNIATLDNCYFDIYDAPAALDSGRYGESGYAYINMPSPFDSAYSYENIGLSSLDVVAEVFTYQIDSGTATFVTAGGNATENISGDTEVELDYPDYSPGSTACNESAASFTWGSLYTGFGESTYTFTGAGGVGLCGSTNDFLFASDNSLVGYVDDPGYVHPGLDPPGWETTSTVIRSTVPEPGTLALFAAGLLGFAFSRRRRKA